MGLRRHRAVHAAVPARHHDVSPLATARHPPSVNRREPDREKEETVMTWHMPTTVDEVLRLRAENPEAPIVAGGTFLGHPGPPGAGRGDDWISLQNVRELKRLGAAGDLSVGAMVTHRRLELDPTVVGCLARGQRRVPCGRQPPGAQRRHHGRRPGRRRLRLRPAVDAGRVQRRGRGRERARHPPRSQSRTSSSGTTPPAWRRTSSSPGSSCPVPPAPRPTASCAPARRRTGPPPPSLPSSRATPSASSSARSATAPITSPTSAPSGSPATDQRPRHRRGVRRPHRLHRRQPGHRPRTDAGSSASRSGAP